MCVGVAVGSVWDFEKRELPKEAVPILLEWLPRVGDSTRSAIAVALKQAAGAIAVPALLEEYKRLREARVRGAWQSLFGITIAAHATDSHFDAIAEILRDRKYGSGRDWLTGSLSRMKDPRAKSLAIELLADSQIAGYALGALEELGVPAEAYERIRPLAFHSWDWVARRARRILNMPPIPDSPPWAQSDKGTPDNPH
jgi:hypothetical protein